MGAGASAISSDALPSSKEEALAQGYSFEDIDAYIASHAEVWLHSPNCAATSNTPCLCAPKVSADFDLAAATAAGGACEKGGGTGGIGGGGGGKGGAGGAGGAGGGGGGGGVGGGRGWRAHSSRGVGGSGRQVHAEEVTGCEVGDGYGDGGGDGEAPSTYK